MIFFNGKFQSEVLLIMSVKAGQPAKTMSVVSVIS